MIKIFSNIIFLTLLSSCSTLALDNSADNALGVKNIEKINTTALTSKNIRKINSKYNDTFNIDPIFLESIEESKRIQVGDAIEILIWEAYPPLLFNSPVMNDAGNAKPVNSSNLIPVQTVNSNGMVDVPFIGLIEVAGLTEFEVTRIIENKLEPLSNTPQVSIHYVYDNSSMVNLLGDVNNSMRVPINYGGLKLLDLITQNGEIRKNIDLISVSVSRKDVNFKVPLKEIINNPSKNISLKHGDIVLLESESSSFMSLGAVSSNRKVKFKQGGISLTEGLSRIGGWQDQRANIKKVLIYRKNTTGDAPGEIFSVDMTNINSLGIASDFIIKDGDVIYLSNNLRYETQKFLSLIGSVVNPFMGINNVQNTITD